MLATLVLSELLRICAPNVAPQTMAAIVHVESGGKVYALHDNTLKRSFSAASPAQAIAWAQRLVDLGHSVDIGLSQVNSANLPGLGLTVADAFGPCTNLHAGATILGGDYASAVRQFGPGQYALRRALGAYNTGSLYAGQDYINEILVAAGMPPEGGPSAPPATSQAQTDTQAAHPDYTTRHVPGSPVEIIQGNQ